MANHLIQYKEKDKVKNRSPPSAYGQVGALSYGLSFLEKNRLHINFLSPTLVCLSPPLFLREPFFPFEPLIESHKKLQKKPRKPSKIQIPILSPPPLCGVSNFFHPFFQVGRAPRNNPLLPTFHPTTHCFELEVFLFELHHSIFCHGSGHYLEPRPSQEHKHTLFL